MTRLVQQADGSWIEVRPQACPQCAAPWHTGPRARFQAGSEIAGGHAIRTWLCLDCGHEIRGRAGAPQLMAPNGRLTLS